MTWCVGYWTCGILFFKIHINSFQTHDPFFMDSLLVLTLCRWLGLFVREDRKVFMIENVKCNSICEARQNYQLLRDVLLCMRMRRYYIPHNNGKMFTIRAWCVSIAPLFFCRTLYKHDKMRRKLMRPAFMRCGLCVYSPDGSFMVDGLRGRSSVFSGRLGACYVQYVRKGNDVAIENIVWIWKEENDGK